MPTYNPNDFYPRTGAEIQSNGNVVNEADGINSDGSENEVLTGVIRKNPDITVNALAITDTNVHDFSIDLSKFDIIAFEVTNTLNQSISIQLLKAPNVAWWDVDGTTQLFSSTILGNSRSSLITQDVASWQRINTSAIQTATLRLVCSVAPTSGNVTVRLFKRNVGAVFA